VKKHPVIPKEEFKERQEKVRQKMKEKGFDLLIAYADDGAVFGQEYTRWLFNYQPHFEPACVIIPAEGEPVLLTGYESVEYIYASSYCENVQVIEEFVYGAHEFPFAEIVPMDVPINNALKEMGREARKVGIVGYEKVPHHLYKRIVEIVGEENVEPADSTILDLRLTKSENEIKVIEYAYHIAEKGIEAAIEAIKAGREERHVAAEAEYVMRSLGAEGMGIDTMVASGKRNTYPIIARTSFRKIQENDLVTLTIAPRYEGYHGAIARPVIVGKVDQEIEHAINTAIQAQKAAKELLKPGGKGAQIDAAARKVAKEGGLADHFVYTGGHSIGVSEFEPPSLNALFKDPIEENMVFSIDIPLFFNDWGGLRLEDGFHVTKNGARPLQSIENKLIRI